MLLRAPLPARVFLESGFGCLQDSLFCFEKIYAEDSSGRGCCCDAFSSRQGTTCLRIQECFAARELLASTWHQLVQAPPFLYFSTFNCSIFLAWQKEEGGGLPGGDNSSALLNLQDQIVLAQIGHSQLASKQPISVENNTMATAPARAGHCPSCPYPQVHHRPPLTHLCPSVTNLPPKCATNKHHVPLCLCLGCAGPVPGLCTTTASPEKLPADGL